MLTPRDPAAFRADVLRRAVRIERRRRRARVLMVAPGVVAAVLLGALLLQRSSDGDAADVAAGAGDGVVRVEAVALPDDASPWAVVVGTDQAVWVLSREPATAVVRRARDGEVRTLPLPADAEPEALVAGTDGGIWMTDPPNRRVLRIDGDGDVRTWPTGAVPSPGATWLSGRLWFAEPALDRITGISAEGDVVHHDVPRGRAPGIVAAGPDGAVWYASSTVSIVGSVATGAGTVNEIDLGGTPDERATVMATGPGPALWLVVRGPAGSRLARVDTSGRVVGDALTAPIEPLALSVGPNGRLWFTVGDGTVQQQSLARITITPLGQPFDAASWALAADDAMWGVDRMRRTLLRIDVGS